MKDLLDKVKTKLLTYQNTTLSDVRTWKKGTLSTATVFPAIAVVPIDEEHSGGWAGNQYDNTRQIQLEVFSRGADRLSAIEKVKSIVNELHTIVKTELDWDGLTIDTIRGGPNIEDPIALDKGIIAIATLPLFIVSQEVKPDDRDPGETTYYTSKQIIDQLEVIMREYHDVPVGDLDLSNIYGIHKSSFPSIAKYPAITITSPTMSVERTYAGVDTENRLFEISIWTKLLAQEVQLDNNLDTVEVVVDILQKRGKWGTNCKIDNIIYDTDTIPVGKVYVSKINWICDIFSVN